MNDLLYYVKENQTPTYSSLNFFIFLSLQFSDFIYLFSGTGAYKVESWSIHGQWLVHHVYLKLAAGGYLFFYFFNFLSH